MRELVFPYGLKLLIHSATFYLKDLGFWFISMHKGILVKHKIALDLMNSLSRMTSLIN